MHFNKKRFDEVQIGLNSSANYDSSIRMILIDSIKVDDQTRLTFTKRVKNVFPIISGDIIAVYQDIITKDLFFRVQREEKIVDSWLVKRNDMAKNTIGVSNPIDNFSKHSQESYLSYPYVVTTKVKPKTKQQQRKYNGTQNILIVDDEPDVILSFTSCLSSEGYNIETFTESREALRHFLELDNPGYYQLSIIDIRMPAINGVQLYQILRTLNPGIKVLFVSALDAAVELTSIFPEVMSKDIIRKPITEDAFVKKVSATLSTA